jgi:hypothetical protein
MFLLAKLVKLMFFCVVGDALRIFLAEVSS